VNAIKISLITVCRNAVGTIARCMDSVIRQDYAHVEYIIIDGNSVDGTREMILKSKSDTHLFISEEDGGIYDAINKGIKHASGAVLGLLNADDYFADEHALGQVANVFYSDDPDLLYADLDYVDGKGKVLRKWRSGNYVPDKFNRGWMPPHPTFYAKRQLFDNFGLYNSDYGSAADYELMLRFMYLHQAKVSYLKRVIVKMETGGVSNRNLCNRMMAWQADFQAMKSNGIKNPFIAVLLKPIRKITQFTGSS
jgi:glycosyltransferase involved in cell wall biosynthesis